MYSVAKLRLLRRSGWSDGGEGPCGHDDGTIQRMECERSFFTVRYAFCVTGSESNGGRAASSPRVATTDHDTVAL